MKFQNKDIMFYNENEFEYNKTYYEYDTFTNRYYMLVPSNNLSSHMDGALVKKRISKKIYTDILIQTIKEVKEAEIITDKYKQEGNIEIISKIEK